MDTDNSSGLHTAPSFSIYATDDGVQEHVQALANTEFSFQKKSMELIAEEEEAEEDKKLLGRIKAMRVDKGDGGNVPGSPPMYLAAGLGIEGPVGENIDLKPVDSDDSGDVEDYYRRMVYEYPNHPLILKNYAQLLQSKGDIHGAEEYYFRATIADPEDGNILMCYAKIVWETHHDKDKALIYYERAAHAAPRDSNVLAAFALFLWEIDGGDEDRVEEAHNQIKEENLSTEVDNSASKKDIEPINSFTHVAAGLDRDVSDPAASDPNKKSDTEEYYKKMVEEDPSNPIFLINYAQFLSQSKGELQEAGDIYLRAIAADPSNGELISEYARLVWDHHHDHDKALSYFKQAVQLSPGDSNVLAAYARFLWETEPNGEENPERNDCHLDSSAV